MAKTNPVVAYLRAQPPAARRQLQQLRATIRAALPGAEEVISYQIPAFKLDGRPILYIAAWKTHCAVYPLSKAMLARFEQELAALKVKGRTLQLPLTGKLPVKLIGALAKFRAKERLEER